MKGNSNFFLILAVFGGASVALAQPGGGEPRLNPDRVIERMDSDGDGRLSFDEFREPPHAWARFDEADSNGDGMVSREEVEARVQQEVERRLDRIDEMFARADLNNDGFITEDERRESAFLAVDLNEDGYLTADELAQAREARGERRGQRSSRRSGGRRS